MKVIGRSDKKKINIVEISDDELSNLLGFYSIYSDGAYAAIGCGTELKISGMFHQLYNLSLNKKTLSKLSISLREIADLLEIKNPIVDELTEENKE